MRNLLPLLALAAGVAGCTSLTQRAQVATGFSAHLLCDDVFLTGRDANLAFEERLARFPPLAPWLPLMSREVDPARREVTVRLAGGFASSARRHPVLGCVVGAAEPATEAEVPPLPPDPAGPTAVQAASPALRAVLQAAVAGAPHHTKAVVVMQRGRIVGEHYAPGYGVDTPVLGFSASKSMTNALVGILVRQGRLALDAPAPLPAWAGPGDPRRAITLQHLLRQTSGLDLLQDNSGGDANARIMYTALDKAAEAAAAPLAVPPGTRWGYADTNFLLVSRVLRDAVGGSAADVQRFAQQELFAPLGLRHVRMDFDGTGTPIGASHISASARDWARLGQLFLDDGVAGGRRVLPEGWVTFSATPTLDTGYGAGWWTNRRAGLVPGWGVPWGLPSAPADTFFARGFMGQFVVVVPSEQLVVVRLSVSQFRGDDIEETDRIVAALRRALATAAGSAPSGT